MLKYYKLMTPCFSVETEKKYEKQEKKNKFIQSPIHS